MTVHFQDEARFGRMTLKGRRLVKRGVKPIVLTETCRENFYVYGSISPEEGSHCMVIKDRMSAENFQSFLNVFAQEYPTGFHVMVCDGSKIHWSRKLKLPQNLVLLKLPPYCPELYPIERLWQELKRPHKGQVWSSLSQLKDQVVKKLAEFGFDKLFTLADWDWIHEAYLYNR